MQYNQQNEDQHNTRIPVLDQYMRPLMPCHPGRARQMLNDGKARAYRNKLGVFCIILHKDVEPNNQRLALGVDPGSRFEGWSVVGTKSTVLNGMSEAPTWIKGNVQTRKGLRRSRRGRNCPRRQCRSDNRTKCELPPSTKSRWQSKLNIVKHLQSILPIQTVVVEDVKAVAKKNCKRWNTNFSPIEAGKRWFYSQLRQLGLRLVTKEGHEAKALRDRQGLYKCNQKDKAAFQSHAVDAWVLAASETKAERPTWKGLLYWTPIQVHRRQLHALQPSKGGLRRPYGGTRSMGLTRGTLVRCIKHGLTYVGGTLKNRVSLHRLSDGNRLTQNARVEDLDVLTTIHWRARLLPTQKGGVSAAHD